MLTIDLNYFFPSEPEKADACVDIVVSLLGEPAKRLDVKDDEDDEESSYSILLNYSHLKMEDIQIWDELQEMGTDNEIYVLVYDHETQQRIGFWYDEDDVWVERDMTGNDYYSKLMSNH
jgi:hypothetical protein